MEGLTRRSRYPNLSLGGFHEAACDQKDSLTSETKEKETT